MTSSVHKALLVLEKGAPPTVDTRPTPKPGKDEILVKVSATSINPIDAYMGLMGAFIQSYPATLGCDAAGIVEEVGEDVKTFVKGDRVLFAGDFKPDFHTYQEYALGYESTSCKIPANMTFEEASTIPLVLGTAAVGMYGVLKTPHGGAGLVAPWVEGGRNKYHNEPAIVIGGASGVGQYAIQLAKMSGFNPIITSASSHNTAYCEAAGATHVIDYQKTPYGPAFVEAVSSITTAPIKFIYDAISAEASQTACWSILAPGGKLVVANPNASKDIGQPGVEDKDGRRVVTVFGSVHNDEVGGDVELGKSMYVALETMLRDGDIKPSKVELLPGGLSGLPEGFARLVAKKISGAKMVVRVEDTPK